MNLPTDLKVGVPAQAPSSRESKPSEEGRSVIVPEPEPLPQPSQEVDAINKQNLGEACDRKTGNEFDDNRNTALPTVSFNELANDADFPIEACRKAVDANPQTPRYRYQLGRVLLAAKSVEGVEELNEMVQEKYAAAFDNLAAYYKGKGDLKRSISLINEGAALGNSQAMLNYGLLLLDGEGVKRNRDLGIKYIRRAAKKGHRRAITEMKLRNLDGVQ